MKTLVAAALLLALVVPAHAAQKWYLAVDIYTHDNRGGINDPDKMYLEHAFNSRSECIERAHAFRKQCRGLIADQTLYVGGAGITKFITYCQQHSQQPGPVLIATEVDGEVFKQEQECAE
jgi:hypothetical protein